MEVALEKPRPPRRVKSALITVGALDFKRRKPMAVTARRKSVVADSANPR